MAHKPIPTYLALLFAFANSITALSLPLDHVFRRDSTCGDPSSTQCPGMPNGFCCGTTTQCLVVASNTTLLCCPKGQTCDQIGPITCDISQQNVSLHPKGALFTTNLTATLQSCGSNTCCPLGYACQGGNSCVLIKQTSSSSSSSTPPPTAAASSTTSTTGPGAVVATSACASSFEPSSPLQQSCNAFPPGAVVAGFFPGLFTGALLAVAGFCFLGARRRRQRGEDRDSSNGSFGKVAASISDPIYQQPAIRTDFIRKQNTPPRASPTMNRQPTIRRVRSLFRRSTAATSPEMTQPPARSPFAPTPPMPRPLNLPNHNHQQRHGSPPVTPRLQREPSGESINIFADSSVPASASPMGNTGQFVSHGGPGRRNLVPVPMPMTASEERRFRGASHQTTFTDMLEREIDARTQPLPQQGTHGVRGPGGNEEGLPRVRGGGGGYDSHLAQQGGRR